MLAWTHLVLAKHHVHMALQNVRIRFAHMWHNHRAQRCSDHRSNHGPTDAPAVQARLIDHYMAEIAMMATWAALHWHSGFFSVFDWTWFHAWPSILRCNCHWADAHIVLSCYAVAPLHPATLLVYPQSFRPFGIPEVYPCSITHTHTKKNWSKRQSPTCQDGQYKKKKPEFTLLLVMICLTSVFHTQLRFTMRPTRLAHPLRAALWLNKWALCPA